MLVVKRSNVTHSRTHTHTQSINVLVFHSKWKRKKWITRQCDSCWSSIVSNEFSRRNWACIWSLHPGTIKDTQLLVNRTVEEAITARDHRLVLRHKPRHTIRHPFRIGLALLFHNGYSAITNLLFYHSIQNIRKQMNPFHLFTIEYFCVSFEFYCFK